MNPIRQWFRARTRQRVSNQPSVLLAAITAMTTVRNNGQSRSISPTIVGGILRAIMQPMTACAISTSRCGTRRLAPATARRMPAIIGPSSRAAGRRMSSRPNPKMPERTTRIAHCWLAVWAMNGRWRNWQVGASIRPVAAGRMQPSVGRLRTRQHRAGSRSVAWGTECCCGCSWRTPPAPRSTC